MLLIKPSYTFISMPLGAEKDIESAGRTCYKSEGNISDGSARKFCQKILERGHESVIEHISMTVRFICDRGVSHELVRHRLASFSQESTRYCNYAKDKFGKQLTFIIPPWVNVEAGEYWVPSDMASGPAKNPSMPESLDNAGALWFLSLQEAESSYLMLIEAGWKPQHARSVLPNSLKTEVVMTANFREWRHVFKLRCSKAAHPQMRELMVPLWRQCVDHWPVIFGDCHDGSD